MNDQRFLRLSEISQSKWLLGCPVEIDKGALLLDNITKQIILQVRLRNVGELIINQVDFLVYRYDLSGDPIESSDPCISASLTDLSAGPSSTFGEVTPIILGVNQTRQIKIIFKKVIFSDKYAWRNDNELEGDAVQLDPLVATFTPELLEQFYRDYRKEYSKGINQFPKTSPQFLDDRWICTCGFQNDVSRNYCGRCKVEKNWLYSAVNQDNLSRNLTQYLEEMVKQEQARIERETIEKKRIEEEKEKLRIETELKKIEINKRKKRILKISAVVIIAVMLLAVLSLAFTKYAVPAIKYNNALKLHNSNQYDKAISIMMELGNYKDSSEQVKIFTYDKALNCLEADRYVEAISIFGSLGEFKESKSLLQKSNYLYAGELASLGKNEEAIKIYDSLGNYENSRELLLLIYSKIGDEELKKGDYDNAINHYRLAKNSEKIKEAANLAGEAALKKNDFSRAKFYFGAAYNNEMIKECTYQEAKQLIANGNVRDGYFRFKILSDYKDSKQLADKYRKEATKWRIEGGMNKSSYGADDSWSFKITAYGGDRGEVLEIREYCYTTSSKLTKAKFTYTLYDGQSYESEGWSYNNKSFNPSYEDAYMEFRNEKTGERIARFNFSIY